MLTFKIKEANIFDAETSDIKDICKKGRAQEAPNIITPELLASITENPYKVVEFLIGGGR